MAAFRATSSTSSRFLPECTLLWASKLPSRTDSSLVSQWMVALRSMKWSRHQKTTISQAIT